MIKTKKQILLEGRYDSLTRIISRDIISCIKETEGSYDESEYFSLPFEKNGEEYYQGPNLNINVELTILRTNDNIEHNGKEIPYYVKSYIDDEDYLNFEILINNNYDKEYYEEIFYKINEDVRHELEHLLQGIFSDRQQPNIEYTADYESTFEHHMDPSEVEALVHGFYRRAKIEKKPLDIVMMDDLNHEIMLGNLSREESSKLLNTWITYARRRLPDAIYSF